MPYLSQLLVGLFKVEGFPQMVIRIEVDVRVILALGRVAVTLLALLQALWVGLFMILLSFPVRLV